MWKTQPSTRFTPIPRLTQPLSLVMRYVLDGCWGATNECAEPTWAYFTYRKELTIIDGLLVKGNCIVIPTNMCHDCLETWHASHLVWIRHSCEHALLYFGQVWLLTLLHWSPTALHAKSSNPNNHLNPSGMTYLQLSHGPDSQLIYVNLMESHILLL